MSVFQCIIIKYLLCFSGYFSFSDIASFFKGGDKAETVCNECGTELELLASSDNN